MRDDLKSGEKKLVPSENRDLSPARHGLFRRGLELAANLDKGTRVIAFPRDRSAGKLFITYTIDSPVSHKCTEFLCEAQGNVSVTAGNHLLLVIDEEYPSDLSALLTLKPGDLDALDIAYNHVGDRELACLQKLTMLRELVLFYCWSITDEGLMHLQGLNSLRSVVIEGSRIGDRGLEYLYALPALQDLHLTNTQVTSDGLSILQKFPALRDCKLWYTDLIGDAGLAHLGRLTKLERLSLIGTKITDAGLEHLRDLKNLKGLALSATVSDVGLSRIKNYLPHCKVAVEDSKP